MAQISTNSWSHKFGSPPPPGKGPKCGDSVENSRKILELTHRVKMIRKKA